MLNGTFYSLPYEVLNDFAAVSPWGHVPFILFGRKALPGKDLNELIAWLKANPNKASAGISTTSGHLLTAFFQKEIGTELTFVPYRGSAPAVQDLMAGQIDLSFQALEPYQTEKEIAGKPISPKVGISGASDERVSPATA